MLNPIWETSVDPMLDHILCSGHGDIPWKADLPCTCAAVLFIGNLWYRQGITPSYPQGSSWEHISNNVRKVSVGPLDQVSAVWSMNQIYLIVYKGSGLGFSPVSRCGQPGQLCPNQIHLVLDICVHSFCCPIICLPIYVIRCTVLDCLRIA